MLSQAVKQAVLRPKRRHFLDTFATLSPRWVVQAGTLAVDGGALKASALGDWGNNLITNGEFTANTTGWTASASAILSSVAGGQSGYCLRVENGAAAYGYASQSMACIVGGAYSARVYEKNGDTSGHLRIPAAGTLVNVTVSSVDWRQLTRSFVANATPLTYRIGPESNLLGETVFFDSAECYRQNAAAIMQFSPHFRARLTHISPAAPSVVPAGWMFRYTDALNYWELRVLPNTGGNDMQIVQVTAGAETVRAEADVDWTAEGTDEVELIARGSTITTRYRKAGGVWTAGPSYASATQGGAASAMGPMLYGTTVAPWAEVELWA